MAARIFDSYRWADDPTSKRASGLKEQKALEALLPDLWSDYQGLYKDYQTKYKATDLAWGKLNPEYEYQKSRETPDWTKYKSLSSAYDKVGAISDAADRKAKAAFSKYEESVGKQVFSPEEFDERYGAEGTGKGQWNYTNPEGTFTRSGDLWKNIATGKLRNPDSFRNLDGTPVLERQDLEGEKADAEQQERIEKETWGIVRDKKKPTGGPTLAERLRSLTNLQRTGPGIATETPEFANAVAMADPLSNLPSGVEEDMLKGGKTSSPLGDLAILGATGAAVKGLPALAGSAVKAGTNLLKNEVAKMTVTDAAFKKGLLPELTRSGVKNWQHLRPFKAFTPQLLKTGPTPAAAVGSALTIEGAGAPAAKGSSWDQYLQRNVMQIPDISMVDPSTYSGGSGMYGHYDIGDGISRSGQQIQNMRNKRIGSPKTLKLLDKFQIPGV